MATARITVSVQPRASRPGLVSVDGHGVVKLRVASPPVEGKANAETLLAMAEALGVPKRSVRLVSGVASRTKIVEVDGLDDAAARLRIGMALGERQERLDL